MSYPTINNELDDDFEAFLRENEGYNFEEVSVMLDEIYHNQARDFIERTPHIVLNGDLMMDDELFEKLVHALEIPKELLDE